MLARRIDANRSLGDLHILAHRRDAAFANQHGGVVDHTARDGVHRRGSDRDRPPGGLARHLRMGSCPAYHRGGSQHPKQHQSQTTRADHQVFLPRNSVHKTLGGKPVRSVVSSGH